MRYLLMRALLLALPVFGVASKVNTPLFGTVTGVAANDTLNIRTRPDYRSPKTGALPPEAMVGVEQCRRIKHATWCRIHHLAQYDYPQFHYGARPGWVNARFLKRSSRGYVLVDGKGHCDYALSCQGNECDVVTDLRTDTQNRVTRLIHHPIARKRLRAASHFGAAADTGGDGYCTDGRYIEDFLNRKSHSKSPTPTTLIHQTVQWIHSGNITALARHVHPTHGITLTEMVSFEDEARLRFTSQSLLSALRSKKLLYWGNDYAKGDPIRMTLHEYFTLLTRKPAAITRIDAPCKQNIRSFAVKHHGRLTCREARWINSHSQTRDYDWLGLVVVMEQYRGKWYIVGLMHDRWTI